MSGPHLNPKTVLNAAYWILLAAMLMLRFWFAFRVWLSGGRMLPERGALQREGWRANAIAWVFFPLLALVVFLWLRGDSLRQFTFPAPDAVRWSGVAVGLLSLGLFAWTHAVLGRFWSPHLQLRPGHRLIAGGPYSRIRHPMYSAILGWMLSLGLVAVSWIPFVFAALCALNFFLRIQGEEAMMLQQFGPEYRAYMHRTGRLFPHV